MTGGTDWVGPHVCGGPQEVQQEQELDQEIRQEVRCFPCLGLVDQAGNVTSLVPEMGRVHDVFNVAKI